MKKFLHTIIIMAASAAIFVGCHTPKLADADAAFMRGEYFNAQKIYRELYNRTSPKEKRTLRGEIAFKLGQCYSRLNDVPKAANAFANAIRNGNPDSTAIFHYARSLQADGKYKDAINEYERFLSLSPTGKEGELAREGVAGCRLAIASSSKKDSRYVVKPMTLFTTNRSEFAPVIAAPEFDQLFFTSTSELATGETHSNVTGMKRGDIFMSKKDENGNWQKPQKLEGEINSEADEGIISLTPDGTTMFLTRASGATGSDETIGIFTSRRSDGVWNEPVRFEIDVDSTFSVGHPSVSPDGKWLFFASDMPGGYGGLDIWKVALSGKKERPLNLGPQINTSGNECFPYSRNDSLIYFSSDGHPGFGGLDIFKATLNSTGDYWTVENPGIPLNSSGDDFGITFAGGESGFLSSNRNDRRGRDHIFSFVKPEISITISGTVMDMDEEPVAGAVIRIVGNDGSNQKQISRDDGTFRFNLDRGVSYIMKAGADGYLNVSQEFESADEEEDAEYEIDFTLASISKPQVVENIFYDFDKATLRPESKSALDEMARMLRENPNVTIEMGAHTDRKGTDAYNQKLSERRAKSVVDYLIASGIDPARLKPKGYGKTVPKTVTRRINREYPQFREGIILDEKFIETLSPEDREAADQINRRTEFKVLSTDFEIF